MSEPDPRELSQPLLRWFDAHRREMPWRGTRDPYRIWVSEIMLQQTQVDTVRRYYERFLERFPTVEALGRAEEDDVLAAWSGLGFYRRARNLHRAAHQVAEELAGVVPREPGELAKLPGLGRYTVGAILSIAHDDRLPILDGNVIRVLTRLFRVAGDPKRSATNKRLWALAEAVLPLKRCGDFNQALMELGALVCRPTSPACPECPLRELCAAKAADDIASFPESSRKKPVPEVERTALHLVRPDGRFLIEQRPAEGLLASMWELPSANSEGQAEQAAQALARTRGARGTPRLLGIAEHRFSHRLWTIRVYSLATRARAAIGRGIWVSEEELGSYGVPTLTRKVLTVAQQRAVL